MPNESSNPALPDNPRWSFAMLVAGYLDDRLNHEQLNILAEEMRSEPARQEEFVDLCLQAHMLSEHLSATQSQDEQTSTAAASGNLNSPTSPRESAIVLRSMLDERPTAFEDDGNIENTFTEDAKDSEPRRMQTPLAGKKSAYRLAALIAVAVGTLAFLFIASRPAKQSPVIVQAEAPRILGRITGAVDCRWKDGSALGSLGSQLGTGHLNLDSGQLEITFINGVRMSVEGPTNIELKSVGVVNLRRGRLAADVSAGGVGFTVQTPRGNVVDLGTKFGVEVGRDQTTDVEVLVGNVVVNLPKTQGAPAQTKPISRGQALRFSKTEGIVAIPSSPARFAALETTQPLAATPSNEPVVRERRIQRLLKNPQLLALYAAAPGQQPTAQLVNRAARPDTAGWTGTLSNSTDPGDGRSTGPVWSTPRDI
ncbi:MAG: FecR domain-containing protein, partial [Planctomycetaceae bacterium]|nr:FecR domain-containing protein [Planctomycetaceae bacterium]